MIIYKILSAFYIFLKNVRKFRKFTIDKQEENVLIYILLSTTEVTYAEVVELVYGTSLENWRRFIAYRGFESHPLRHFFIN